MAQPVPSKPSAPHQTMTAADEFAKAMVDTVLAGKADFCYVFMAAKLKAIGEKRTPAE